MSTGTIYNLRAVLAMAGIARQAALLGALSVAAAATLPKIGTSAQPSAARRSDTGLGSVVDSSTIWRCPKNEQMFAASSEVVPPNVSVGIYILNLGQEISSGTGIGSGVFFADFLLFLRQMDRPLNRWR